VLFHILQKEYFKGVCSLKLHCHVQFQDSIVSVASIASSQKFELPFHGTGLCSHKYLDLHFVDNRFECRSTNFPHWGYRGFPQPVHTNTEIITSDILQALLSKSYPPTIHLILFHTTWLQLMLCLGTIEDSSNPHQYFKRMLKLTSS
jgi:hypothetical protein